MGRIAPALVWAVSMAAIIVAADIVLFRGHFWPRLAANVGIVLVVGALYFRFHSHA